MDTHQLADPRMKIPDMLQNAINPIIKRPSFGQKGQGNGSIVLFIRLPIWFFDLGGFFSLGLDRIFLLEILFKGSLAYKPLSRLNANLPSLYYVINLIFYGIVKIIQDFLS